MRDKTSGGGKKGTRKAKSTVKVQDLPVRKKATSITGGAAAAEPGDTPVIVGLNKRM
ncbi:MAG TPA: hypothetical protein VLT62_09295 [Candidatus Methylomirabilis sp.]|nr:hypothetical protein [Candidatus Methylomirabilis sp.]